jgi:hypothetical protein
MIVRHAPPCHASPAVSDIGKKMPVRDAPPCHASAAASYIGKKMSVHDAPPCRSAAATDIGKKMPVRDVPPCSRARTVRAETIAIAKTKTPAVLGCGEAEIEKMKETKRKFPEGYQREADAKRQRRIQLIKAPKMPEQPPSKVHPILMERSRARCGALPCSRARTVRADMAAIAKTKTSFHAAAPAADIGKKMPVSYASPCSRARTVHADMAAIAKTKTPCLAAADIGRKKMPVSDAPPCSRARTVRANTAAMDKTKASCPAAPAAEIGKKMTLSEAPPCNRVRTVRDDMAAIAKTKTLCLAAPAVDIGKKMPVSDAPACSRENPLRAETAATAKTKKTPAVLGNGEAEIEKMKETKRKFAEGYQREADAKRQRRIQLIEAPKSNRRARCTPS